MSYALHGDTNEGGVTMAIGEFDPKQAKGSNLQGAIAIGLDEALTALEESFQDLTDEQVASFAFPERHNIATLVMHMIENLDTYACKFQCGQMTLEHDDRFNVWAIKDGNRPFPAEDLPCVGEMVDRIHLLRAIAEKALAEATDEDLQGARFAEDWWTGPGKNSADAYLRTIYHTMAHVRQIWLMRGAIGLADQGAWPQQHWA